MNFSVLNVFFNAKSVMVIKDSGSLVLTFISSWDWELFQYHVLVSSFVCLIILLPPRNEQQTEFQQVRNDAGDH